MYVHRFIGLRNKAKIWGYTMLSKLRGRRHYYRIREAPEIGAEVGAMTRCLMVKGLTRKEVGITSFLF